MTDLIKALIAVAVLGFLLAVVVVLFTGPIAGIGAEAFSRSCTNLALVAIALHLTTVGAGSATGDRVG